MQYNPITQGKLLPAFLKFTIPMLLAYFLQTMYGAVDLLIVGRFSDAANVSAVSIGTQIMQTFTSFVTGLTMGTTVLLGNAIGAKNDTAASKALTSSCVLFGGLAVLIAVMQFGSAVPFAGAMQAPAEAFAHTVTYVRITGIGMLFVVAYNTISGVLRAMGDAKLPLVLVAIACVVNIIGDLILVGLCGMGAAGAAYATIGAQAVSVLLCVPVLRRRGLPFVFDKANGKANRRTAVRVLTTGLPVALQNTLTGLSFLMISAIINSRGVIASAGMGVAEKLCGFIMLVPMAFMASLSAFVAQNIGAGNLKRANQSLKYSLILSLAFGVCAFVPSFFFGESMTGIFSTDAAVITAGAEYLKAYAIDCILVAFIFSFTGYFNGCGKTVFVMVQGLACAFAVRVPLAYVFSLIPGSTLFHIGLATPISSVVGIVLCGIYFYRFIKQRRLCAE